MQIEVNLLIWLFEYSGYLQAVYISDCEQATNTQLQTKI